MTEDMIDQTAFMQDPVTSEAIPEKAIAGAVVSPLASKKRPIVMLGIGGVVLVLFVVIGILSSVRRKSPVQTSATPSPSLQPVEASVIRAEIAPYLDTIESLNPESDENPFPPVHFDVRIKEPGSQ